MEALTSIMSIIDQNSESISEGDYLKLCNLMKDLHKVVPKKVVPPFLAVDIPEDLMIRREHWNREYYRLAQEMRTIQSRLRAIKIRRNVTQSVRREAFRDAARREGVVLTSFSFDSLRANGIVVDSPYLFFKNYLERTNAGSMRLKEDLEERYQRCVQEQSEISEESRIVTQEIQMRSR